MCRYRYNCEFCHYEHEKRKRKNKKKIKKKAPCSLHPFSTLFDGVSLSETCNDLLMVRRGHRNGWLQQS